MMNDSNAVQEFNKFMNIFLNDKNTINQKIFNLLTLNDDELNDLICDDWVY